MIETLYVVAEVVVLFFGLVALVALVGNAAKYISGRD